jgi:hypothetical protein
MTDSTSMYQDFSVPQVPTFGFQFAAVEKKRDFYFEDTQVVLQASHSNTRLPSTLLTISPHRWKKRHTKSIVIS